jgi:hypothetical protein
MSFCENIKLDAFAKTRRTRGQETVPKVREFLPDHLSVNIPLMRLVGESKIICRSCMKADLVKNLA